MMENWATVHLSCEIVTLLLCFKCQQTFWLSLLINLLSSIEVYCQPPTEVEQGYVVAVQKTEYEVGFDIHYLCKKNFLLDGPQMITCLSNGSWSAPPPHCRGEERSNLISGLFNKAEVKCRETPLHKVLETQINVHLHTAINKHSIMCLILSYLVGHPHSSLSHSCRAKPRDDWWRETLAVWCYRCHGSPRGKRDVLLQTFS